MLLLLLLQLLLLLLLLFVLLLLLLSLLLALIGQFFIPCTQTPGEGGNSLHVSSDKRTHGITSAG